MRPPTRLGLACLVALALASCGRRGPLELPPGAPPAANASPSSLAAQNRVLNDQDTPGIMQSPNRVIERTAAQKQQDIFSEGQVPRPINAPPQSRKSTFLLDPLL